MELIEPMVRVLKSCTFAIGLLSVIHVSSTGQRIVVSLRRLGLRCMPYCALRLVARSAGDIFAGHETRQNHGDLLEFMTRRVARTHRIRIDATILLAPEGRVDLPRHILDQLLRLYALESSMPECPVCKTDTSDETLVMTGCGHAFCTACRSRLALCPICRTALKSD